MRSLKKTGTDFTTAQGMDPKQFFEVMGKALLLSGQSDSHSVFLGLNEIIELDAKAGGSAFQVV